MKSLANDNRIAHELTAARTKLSANDCLRTAGRGDVSDLPAESVSLLLFVECLRQLQALLETGDSADAAERLRQLLAKGGTHLDIIEQTARQHPDIISAITSDLGVTLS